MHVPFRVYCGTLNCGLRWHVENDFKLCHAFPVPAPAPAPALPADAPTSSMGGSAASTSFRVVTNSSTSPAVLYRCTGDTRMTCGCEGPRDETGVQRWLWLVKLSIPPPHLSNVSDDALTL